MKETSKGLSDEGLFSHALFEDAVFLLARNIDDIHEAGILEGDLLRRLTSKEER